MKIGYALLLNDECHNFIRRVQLELHQALGIGLPRQTPHLTIKSPFETDDIKHHVDYLENLAAKIPPIELVFSGFGFFGQHVIFLDVQENQDLLDLHSRILREVNEKFGLTPHELEGNNVKFHASIAGFNNEEKFREAQELLMKYQPKFRCRATELGLFYYLGEGNGWIVNRRISIGRH